MKRPQLLWSYVARFTGPTGYLPGTVTVSGGGFVFARSRESALAKARKLCSETADVTVRPWMVLGFLR